LARVLVGGLPLSQNHDSLTTWNCKKKKTLSINPTINSIYCILSRRWNQNHYTAPTVVRQRHCAHFIVTLSFPATRFLLPSHLQRMKTKAQRHNASTICPHSFCPRLSLNSISPSLIVPPSCVQYYYIVADTRNSNLPKFNTQQTPANGFPQIHHSPSLGPIVIGRAPTSKPTACITQCQHWSQRGRRGLQRTQVPS
jgi:hypothetical protein